MIVMIGVRLIIAVGVEVLICWVIAGEAVGLIEACGVVEVTRVYVRVAPEVTSGVDENPPVGVAVGEAAGVADISWVGEGVAVGFLAARRSPVAVGFRLTVGVAVASSVGAGCVGVAAVAGSWFG